MKAWMRALLVEAKWVLLALAMVAVAALAVLLASGSPGCVASNSRQSVDSPAGAASRPAGLDVQQVAGNVAMAVRANLTDFLHAEVKDAIHGEFTARDVNTTGFASYFGPGAVLVVLAAIGGLLLVVHWAFGLTPWRRERLRYKRSMKTGAHP